MSYCVASFQVRRGSSTASGTPGHVVGISTWVRPITPAEERLRGLVHGFNLCCHRVLCPRDGWPPGVDRLLSCYRYYIKIFECSRPRLPSLTVRAADDRVSMKDFQKDDRVSHSRFGPGVIVAIDGHYTTIEFDESGVRKFVTALVQLERSDLPVPVARAARRRRNAGARRSGTAKA